jgi:hypothetical protein
METIKDILLNLLSDAIWALGGFFIVSLFLKNQFKFESGKIRNPVERQQFAAFTNT